MGVHGIHNIEEIIVHAPYIINLGNAVKPETFELATEFLAKEIERTLAAEVITLILHPVLMLVKVLMLELPRL